MKNNFHFGKMFNRLSWFLNESRRNRSLGPSDRNKMFWFEKKELIMVIHDICLPLYFISTLWTSGTAYREIQQLEQKGENVVLLILTWLCEKCWDDGEVTMDVLPLANPDMKLKESVEGAVHGGV